MRRTVLTLAVLLAACCPAWALRATGPAGNDIVTWSELPEIPPAPGEARQFGLAGAFAGVHNDALIVAGGANFPNGAPWEDGKKKWWDDIYVLVKTGDGHKWIHPKTKLPRPLAYGVSISTKDGVICIGGCDADACYSDVFRITWDADKGDVTVTPLPSLPKPLAFMGGARVGDSIYVVGGTEGVGAATKATDTFEVLDLTQSDADAKWIDLRKDSPLPGPPRLLPVVAAQKFRNDARLYVFSGRDVQPGEKAVFHTDAYRYTLPTASEYKEGRTEGLPWKKLGDIQVAGGEPRSITAGWGITFGAQHILTMGSPGKLFQRIVALQKKAADLTTAAEQEADPTSKAKLLADAAAADKERLGILTNHPGFNRDLLLYHAVTDTWIKRGEFPVGGHVTTTAVSWDGEVVIPSGEISPGVRSPKIWKTTAKERVVSFGALNWAALGVYMAALLAMGFYFSKREKTTGDFFLAGKRIPWWAAGLSIYGTQLSAITFMAIPAATFRLDCVPYVANLTILCIAPFVVYLYLPFFSRLNVTTAYEYLEKRFNVVVRLWSSTSFILYQIGRMAVVVLLPALALSAVTGIDTTLCIIIMGVLCTIYTVLGGIEAVIWTDVLQVVVLLGGAILSFFVIAGKVEGGFAGIISIAQESGKLRVANLTWDHTVMALYIVFFGNFLGNLVPYTTDQAVVQRYLTVKDEKAARRAIWTSAIMTVPGSIIFFGIGVALFAFYRSSPELLDPGLNNNAIFPLFIQQQLPAGIAGLVIAGVFAAAMSSLDSSMNSVATAVTTDFYQRFNPDAPDHTCLKLARIVTVVLGVLGTGAALLLASMEGQSNLWFTFTKIMGLIGGSLAGIFLLAIFTKRANGVGALTGAAAGAGVQCYVALETPIHFFLYAAIGMGVTFVVGYVISVVTGGEEKPLGGLTIYTLNKRTES
jgi:solute:Na+ symporter, SSS family